MKRTARKASASFPLLILSCQIAIAGEARVEQQIQELRERLVQLEKRLGPEQTLESEDKPSYLVAPSSNRLKVSGEIRSRAEYRSLLDYKTVASMDQSDDFALLRTRLNFDVDVNERMRALVQIQDSRKFGEEATTTSDEAGVDLHQAYFEAVLNQSATAPLALRVGRQELRLGSGRLVAECPWSNVGRSLDGLRLTWKGDSWSADFFEMLVQEAGSGSTDDDRAFAGAHYAYQGSNGRRFDVYAYYRHYADGSFTGETGSTGDLRDVTTGARTLLESDTWDCEGEIAFQTGERAEDNVEAWMAVARCGYTFGGLGWRPRLGLEYNFASGDEDPADGRHQGFDDLYGLRHFVLGVGDYTGRSNLHDVDLQVSAKPSENWKISVDYHIFHLGACRSTCLREACRTRLPRSPARCLAVGGRSTVAVCA